MASAVTAVTKDNYQDLSFYEVLGFDEAAQGPTLSEAQVRRSFRKLAVKFHPDMDPSEGAKHVFQRLDLAQRTLIDPELKRAYDEERNAAQADATRVSAAQERASDLYRARVAREEAIAAARRAAQAERNRSAAMQTKLADDMTQTLLDSVPPIRRLEQQMIDEFDIGFDEVKMKHAALRKRLRKRYTTQVMTSTALFLSSFHQQQSAIREVNKT